MEKIAIIGNGSLGSFTAARISHTSAKSIEISIFGKKTRPYAASAAAGLMLNIFSEIDEISYNLPITKWKLDNWQKAINSWSDFFASNGIIPRDNIFTSDFTEVYINSESSNELEQLSFARQKSISSKYGVNNKNDVAHINTLVHEPSADAREVLKELDQHNHEVCKMFDLNVLSIRKNNGKYELQADDNSIHIFDKVIVMAGSKSSRLLNNSDLKQIPSIKCLNGIGSALEIFKEISYLNDIQTDRIVRSPNRGGTCGVHMVQRMNSVYVGASSVITDKDISLPRMGSIHSLIQSCFTELPIGDLVRHSMKILTGYRPVTEDVNPIFGELDNNLFVAYGHKRDGFTWAPFLSNLVSKWAAKIPFNSEEEAYLSLCEPTRERSSYGNKEDSLNLYLMNEKFSMAQHNEDMTPDKKDNLVKRFHKLHSNEEWKHSVCHPELVNANYFKEST